ncbi:MAG: tyrosine-type recombinase/integrase [Clostridia bacterium]|nr:tyrosine-type recombinase/integrase [Clostridia bacterium]
MLTATVSLQSATRFEQYLRENEKSPLTVEKYLRDVKSFCRFVKGNEVTKQTVLSFKRHLGEQYAPASVNSILVAVNGFLSFLGKDDCKVKLQKIQRRIFCKEEKELTPGEYRRLLTAARGTTLELVIRTICETGIRVSELKFITVESLTAGEATVYCKNKTRSILLPKNLQKTLRTYAKKTGIRKGTIFRSRNGNPLNRSCIWRSMKRLCKKAGVAPGKVFPHNLRHLFARTFYTMERDIVRLADLLGHSSINTTRIYTVETGVQHRACLEKLYKRLNT